MIVYDFHKNFGEFRTGRDFSLQDRRIEILKFLQCMLLPYASLSEQLNLEKNSFK